MPLEESILKSTKKILSIGEGDTSFDLDISIFINSVLSDLNQIGVGPPGGLTIQDDTTNWDALGLPENQLNTAKTFIYLKTRMMFDPPATSFAQDAMNKQIDEQLWRLSVYRESLIPVTHTTTSVDPLDGTVETTITEEVVTW